MATIPIAYATPIVVEPAISVHIKYSNFVSMALNPIIYLKIINNIIMFRIMGKYYKKMAMQLLTLIWHVIPLQHNIVNATDLQDTVKKQEVYLKS